MKFYMTPGSCTTGIHILLEELELVFEVDLVNLLAGDQDTAAYRALNPKGTIPTLVRDDGTALTDFVAIAWWLARSWPKRGLLPDDAEGQARVLEVMNHAVGTVHGQGFARIFTTDKFTPNPADHAAVKAQGREIVEQGFAVMNDVLDGRDYAVGDCLTIADAALFYVEFWATRSDIALPPSCLAHYTRMLTRRAVRQVLAEEGYRV
ncbi:glutathione S-transferase [Parazoarcus communis]|uniref:Glutathione S-transferase n=1 Tax=Parazoarcus communis TaxID=41977 RepID=A0A2U8GMQ1_9RHOO|nr:glutathione S-transferase C-terminal domain-containing protein [Parazoarcus communis]AWI74768.1 glutathione S-transferase [Parazoarcus communis]